MLWFHMWCHMVGGGMALIAGGALWSPRSSSASLTVANELAQWGFGLTWTNTVYYGLDSRALIGLVTTLAASIVNVGCFVVIIIIIMLVYWKSSIKQVVCFGAWGCCVVIGEVRWSFTAHACCMYSATFSPSKPTGLRCQSVRCVASSGTGRDTAVSCTTAPVCTGASQPEAMLEEL